MKLSVIIVNYNVKFFLEQCLHSVLKAANEIDMETFVVDNNSVDGSVSMLKEKFPSVKVIANKDNKGFSTANNQAIKLSTGKYVLLLNPDTVVEHDTFKKVIDFMDSHPDAGGLGVKMIDGKGNFLPESKRGLPTPLVAFYKIFGLARLFPKSKIFGKYHLSYLDKEKIHKVDILAGAFMLLRRETINKTGLLDESFFMYGEDIDLSYRINEAGYNNYYFPETRIIHYKGESTKKSSINYVFTFYNAMLIFAKKHFSQKNAKLFSFLIHFAIYFRASLAIFSRFFHKAFPPFCDAALLYLGILFIQSYWGKNVIFTSGGHYPEIFSAIIIPTYILIWLCSVYFSGGYDRPVKIYKIIRGMIVGTVAILLAYSLLPESYRFSRAIILLGTFWGIISMSALRFIFNNFNVKIFELASDKNRRLIIIGENEEAERVENLLRKTYNNIGFVGFVNPFTKKFYSEKFIGSINQINEIIEIYKIDELIFCSKDVSHQTIIDKMSELTATEVSFKIAPEDSLSLIGSNSISTSGDIFTYDINSIKTNQNARNKRLLDFFTSLILLSFSPIVILFQKNYFGFIKNIFLVLFSFKSWVGFFELQNFDIYKLPKIKKGVLNPKDAFIKRKLPPETIEKLNILYARDYKLTTDINIIIKGFKNLGRK
ncbi:MAG: glycosyltransferase [Bacteroidales bacterium]|nr:glycosyltransferase [Bacteroidales bacterium]